MSDDADLQRHAQLLDLSGVVAHDAHGRSEPCRFAILERKGGLAHQAQEVISYHRQRADRGVETFPDARPQWRGVESLWVSHDELVDAAPVAAPVLDLLATYALRAARPVRWLLTPADDGAGDGWCADNSPDSSPGSWLLERRPGSAERSVPPGAGRAADLILPRPLGLDDATLWRSFGFRWGLRRLRTAHLELGDDEIEAVLRAALELARDLEMNDGEER